jgi:hypothetical protein
MDKTVVKAISSGPRRLCMVTSTPLLAASSATNGSDSLSLTSIDEYACELKYLKPQDHKGVVLDADWTAKKDEFAEEIHMASNRFECDIRTLREELIFYKEKANKLELENKQLAIQKVQSIALEDVIKIVNENFVRIMDTTFNKENHRVRRFFWLKMKSLKSGYIYIKILFFFKMPNTNFSTLGKHRVIFCNFISMFENILNRFYTF